MSRAIWLWVFRTEPGTFFWLMSFSVAGQKECTRVDNFSNSAQILLHISQLFSCLSRVWIVFSFKDSELETVWLNLIILHLSTFTTYICTVSKTSNWNSNSQITFNAYRNGSFFVCCASVNFLSLGALFFHRNQISLLFSWVAAAELNWSEDNGANAFQWKNLMLNIWFHQCTIESLQNSSAKGLIWSFLNFF